MLSLLSSNPIDFILVAVSLIIAISLHEFAHAKAADMLGDPTPRLQGRLTVNPLAHLDPLGTLLLFVAGFGWGKPVMFDPYNLSRPHRDTGIISAAGISTNFAIALICSIMLRLFIFFHLGIPTIIGYFLLILIQMNVLLGVFNLLPIDPLDGFKVVGSLLPEKQAAEWYQLQRFGIFFLIALLLPLGPGGTSMLSSILDPIRSLILHLLLPSGLTSGIL